MQIAALVLGILSLLGFLVAFLPCVGWFNWFNIPFAIIGLIIGIISLAAAEPGESKTTGIAGLVCCSFAIVIGAIRLFIGGGIF